MPLTLQELESAARQLAAAERAELAQRLFASVEDELPSAGKVAVEQAWLDEADRRYERCLAGDTRSSPAADALARIRARLGGR